MGVPYFIIIEEQEYDLYANEVGHDKLLILPKRYLEEYDTCDDLGDTKSKGPGAARNYAWDHSKKNGHEYHWVMDDNLDAFHRLNRNIKAEVSDGTVLKCMEDFVHRYENIAISGPNYYSMCKSTDKVPPFITNTRIYSCLLIRNDIPYRWRGRYNEDTDLSLRVMKDGWVTVQFNAFLCGKVTTQRMKGGNTKEFYEEEGTLAKSQMLKDLHPDVADVVWKFNRWHHKVNYKPFKKNPLRMKSYVNPIDRVNNYGMFLTQKSR